MVEFTIETIANLLEGEIEGEGSYKISQVGKIQEAGPSAISFLANAKYESFLYNSNAGAVIVNNDFKPKQPVTTNLIKVEDPYLGFTTVLEEFQKRVNFQKTGVEDPSFIHESATTGKDIYRGAFSYIGANVSIGDNVKIYPHVYIGDDVRIGNNTIIHPGVKIYARSVIGDHCVIHSGVVIGSDGFGFAPQEDGSYKTIPQVGNVIIGNMVDIGANTVIDCATMESTKIGDGVKMDNLIQVAHNVEIGNHTVIAAQSGISGSSKIGKNCVLAGQVGIVGHVEIADKTTIGAQSGVGKSVKSQGKILLGSPAMKRNEYLKSYAGFKDLPNLTVRIRELEKKILNLSSS